MRYFIVAVSLLIALVAGVMVFGTPHQWGALPILIAAAGGFVYGITAKSIS
jgi:hypothetical protein